MTNIRYASAQDCQVVTSTNLYQRQKKFWLGWFGKAIKATVVVQVVMRGVAATALSRVGGAALLASTSSTSSTCFTSTCNRLACLCWLTCSTSSSLMIPIVSFLQHLFPGHWLFLLLCDALQLVCATGSARWLCTLVGGNKLRNKWLGPDSLHGIALR